ncbi:MAG TPA: bifunctional hydroxymethylpyrimidine kinase/phosphomethylpyrimidine kinase [Verrucomicrobiae bacterium]
MRDPEIPAALTIAGSDSGGEAGLQADLKTFDRLRVHGACVVTCVTAQNQRAVSRLEPCSPRMVRAQLEAAASALPVAAAKTGMLYSAAITRETAAFFKESRSIPLVVDPVMVSTSGRRLLQPDGVRALQRELLPLAALVTPNVSEAEILAGMEIESPEDLRTAARKISREFGCAALAKGGHLSGTGAAVDFLCSKEGEWMFSAPRVRAAGLHGTGCTYSAAITAWLARGRSLAQAVKLAKEFITRMISDVS